MLRDFKFRVLNSVITICIWQLFLQKWNPKEKKFGIGTLKEPHEATRYLAEQHEKASTACGENWPTNSLELDEAIFNDTIEPNHYNESAVQVRNNETFGGLGVCTCVLKRFTLCVRCFFCLSNTNRKMVYDRSNMQNFHYSHQLAERH